MRLSSHPPYVCDADLARAGSFQNILFGVEGAVNAVLGLLNPALGSFIGCTPNYPDQTGTNTYGGARTYQNATAGAPGAPRKQPCLAGAGAECRTETNTYANANAVPNRWHFTSYADPAANPKP